MGSLPPFQNSDQGPVIAESSSGRSSSSAGAPTTIAELGFTGAKDPPVHALSENFFSSMALQEVNVAQFTSASWQHAALKVWAYLRANTRLSSPSHTCTPNSSERQKTRGVILAAVLVLVPVHVSCLWLERESNRAGADQRLAGWCSGSDARTCDALVQDNGVAACTLLGCVCSAR